MWLLRSAGREKIASLGVLTGVAALSAWMNGNLLRFDPPASVINCVRPDPEVIDYGDDPV